VTGRVPVFSASRGIQARTPHIAAKGNGGDDQPSRRPITRAV
jgi:hypothetical protein